MQKYASSISDLILNESGVGDHTHVNETDGYKLTSQSINRCAGTIPLQMVYYRRRSYTPRRTYRAPRRTYARPSRRTGVPRLASSDRRTL